MLMSVSRFCLSVLLAAVFLSAPAFSAPQKEPEPESESFSVTDGNGKIVGLYRFNHVDRDEGVFITSMFYKGEKALKHPGKPAVRSYLELAPDLTWGFYRRWVAEGINTREFKLFKYRRDIRLRVSIAGKGKVSDIGKFKPVYLIEAELPHTAAFLVDRKVPEKKLACVNTTLGRIGEAVVRLTGVEPAPEKKSDAVASVNKPLKTEAAVADDSAGANVETAASQDSGSVPEPSAATPSPPPGPEKDAAAGKPKPLKDRSGDVYRFRVEGDCGVVDIWQDHEGAFVRFESAGRVYTPIDK